MSFVIELRFKAEDEVGHHLFLREHKTRVEQEGRPKNKTILISNIPPWCNTNSIRPLFDKFGKIDNLHVNKIAIRSSNLEPIFCLPFL